jgi:hypothetical protein
MLTVLYDELDLVRAFIYSNFSIPSPNDIIPMHNLVLVHWSSRKDDFVPEVGIFAGCTFSVDVTECRLT